jgi:hypothetical protein
VSDGRVRIDDGNTYLVRLIVGAIIAPLAGTLCGAYLLMLFPYLSDMAVSDARSDTLLTLLSTLGWMTGFGLA